MPNLTYLSKRKFRNLYQRYAIYPDRLELTSWFLLHKLTIPIVNIVSIKKSSPSLTLTALKIDLSDFFEHVILEKNTGFFKHIRFIPDNIDAFINKINLLKK